MASWPATLPALRVGATETRQDARLRTQMDAGPPKMRRRFTAAVRNIDGALVLTGTQKQALDTFYVTTTAEGTAAFSMTDPVDGTSASVRFRAPPEAQVISGGSTAARLWEVSLQLEILP